MPDTPEQLAALVRQLAETSPLDHATATRFIMQAYVIGRQSMSAQMSVFLTKGER